MTPPHAPTLALQWQQIADEFCEFNPYADRTIMHNFAGWLAARGVRVASPAAPPPERCPYCGDGPCPHPDIEHPALGVKGCTGPHGRRGSPAEMLAAWAWDRGRSFAAGPDGVVPESVQFWYQVPKVLKDEVFIPAAQRFLDRIGVRAGSPQTPEPR